MNVVLLDTGPLLAYLNASDQYHRWAVKQFEAIHEPVLSCEAVWTEVAHLVQKRGGTTDVLWRLLRNKAVMLSFNLMAEREPVATLMRRYEDLPMSLADACLVRMSELNVDCRVLTADSHFAYYRRFGRQVIPVCLPS